MSDTDSDAYRQRKAFFAQLLTVYGRKPVLEALNDNSIPVYRVHLADSNKRDGIVSQILNLAQQRGIEIIWHSREQLARISRNRKQDQGVAADLALSGYQPVSQFLQQSPGEFQLLAVDNVTNPQNLGMIIRTVCASPLDGIIIPRRGCADLSALVIKASAGTLFKCRILHCDTLLPALQACQQQGAVIATLDAAASQSLFDFRPAGSCIYVLGNETEGVSSAIDQLADTRLAIPMHNRVESLNVAVTAALIAFRQ